MLKAHFVLKKKHHHPGTKSKTTKNCSSKTARLMAITLSEESGSTDAEQFDEDNLNLTEIEIQ